ncbi:nucleoporin GLE1 [Sarotherodon galilaeus]
MSSVHNGILSVNRALSRTQGGHRGKSSAACCCWRGKPGTAQEHTHPRARTHTQTCAYARSPSSSPTVERERESASSERDKQRERERARETIGTQKRLKRLAGRIWRGSGKTLGTDRVPKRRVKEREGEEGLTDSTVGRTEGKEGKEERRREKSKRGEEECEEGARLEHRRILR